MAKDIFDELADNATQLPGQQQGNPNGGAGATGGSESTAAPGESAAQPQGVGTTPTTPQQAATPTATESATPGVTAQNGGATATPAANQPTPTTTVTEEQLNNEEYPKLIAPSVMEVQGKVVNNGQQVMNGDKIGENLDKPIYKADWGKLGAKGIYQGNASIRDNINDYLKWCEDNDVMPDWASMMLYTKDKDISKSATQNVDDEKKRQRQEHYGRLGNLWLNFANMIGASAFGGPKQEFDDPIKLTQRQQALRDVVEAKREKYNSDFLNMAMKQRKQEADERKEDFREKQVLIDAEYKRQKAELDNRYRKLQTDKLQLDIEKSQISNENEQKMWDVKYQKYQKEIEKLDKEIEYVDKNYNAKLQGLSIQREKARHSGGGGSHGGSHRDQYYTTVSTTRENDDGSKTTITERKPSSSSSSSSKPQRDSKGKKRLKK